MSTVGRLRYRGPMRLLALVVVLASSGCSMLLMEPLEDDWHHTREPRCTETAGFAVWDGVLALVDAGVGAWSAYAAKEGGEDYDDIRPMLVGMAIAGIGAAAVHAVSAGVGLRRADRCSAARVKRDLYVEWSAQQRTAPPAPAPGAPPTPAAPPARVDPVTPPPAGGTPAPPAPVDAGPPL